MKKEKAIEILKQQKEKLKDFWTLKDLTWETQTASYILTLFGKDSKEYEFIRTFALHQPY
ncbi:MAG: hypothetical protein ICV81_18585, partial [Flavisolibacter sp.]|nr:hypothetical protein [Flavisolibacter sp.]MBD0287370.1 hypothetical protein [Flavisolibacter sp.]MBD0350220.1 hypothetical protein [Flavisolibacter sp.]